MKLNTTTLCSTSFQEIQHRVRSYIVVEVNPKFLVGESLLLKEVDNDNRETGEEMVGYIKHLTQSGDYDFKDFDAVIISLEMLFLKSLTGDKMLDMTKGGMIYPVLGSWEFTENLTPS